MSDAVIGQGEKQKKNLLFIYKFTHNTYSRTIQHN